MHTTPLQNMTHSRNIDYDALATAMQAMQSYSPGSLAFQRYVSQCTTN